MEQINIFIASSSELKRERMELVDLIQDLNREFKKRDIKLKPVLWEYMDSSMRAERKEDEYLVRLRESDICIVLFWQILGEYTEEELDVAVAEKAAGRKPQTVHVLLKEPADNITPQLVPFKADFAARYPAIPMTTFTSISQLRNLVAEIITK